MDSLSHQYARSDRVEVTRVGERAVLYHRDSRKALVLNPSGSWLWEHMNAPCTGEQLAAALQNRYALPTGQAAQDVQQFIDDLRVHDAIVRS